MLKIWKQAWKKDVPSPSSTSERDDDRSGPSNGTSGLPTSVDSAAVSPPSTDELGLLPVGPLDASGTERPRARESASETVNHPSKKLKLDESSAKLFIGKHLPEKADDEEKESRKPKVYAEIFQEEILNHVKRENTIAIVSSPRSATQIFCQFLKWAVELEECRPNRTISKPRRTALVVVDDDVSVDDQAMELAFDCTLTMGQYTESMCTAKVNPWFDLLQYNVVVVPASKFLDSLLRSTLAISQIHVLAINDAQLIKDQDSHPMVRVMNEFYRVTDSLSRPRILAIATPASDRHFPFDSGMLMLENTLDAKVFGVSNDKRTEILALPDRPSETVVLYNPPSRTADTRLFKELLRLDPGEATFPRHFRAARHVLMELGSCAADLVWHRALKEIDESVAPVYEEDDDGPDSCRISTARTKLRIRDTVKNLNFAMPNLHENSRGFNVTPKFLKLVRILKSCEPYADGFRGIVFVQRRITAYIIADLLRTLGDHLRFIRPCAVVGRDYGTDCAKEQEKVFREFGKGSYNLLIVTKSLEDVDMPRAQVVIRFDLFESHVSNAYVRARTRRRESHLIFMAERGNDVHRRILSLVTDLESDMRRWTDSVLSSPSSSIPPSGLHETNNPYYSDSDDEADGETPSILDPTASGHIRPQDATTVVYRFSAQQGSILSSTGIPLFAYEEQNPGLGTARVYVCTVSLPMSPPLLVSGPACHSQSLARRVACYQVCVELFLRGLLDYTLFPLPPSVSRQSLTALGTNPPTDTEIKGTGTHCYLKKQPDFWKNTLAVPLCPTLYPTIISTNLSGPLSQKHSPILLLTRRPLPRFPSFKLFFSGVPEILHLTQAAPLQVEGRQLRDLHMYTIRVCRALSNRPFICPLETMLYFLAPLPTSWQGVTAGTDLLCVANDIPWDLVSLAAKSWVIPLQTESVEALQQDLIDAVIQDRRVEFTRRYDAIRVRPDLTPLSRPVDSPREDGFENFLEYCKARRKGFEGLQDYDQPLIEVSKIPAFVNRLNPMSKPIAASTKHPAKYLIPELCAKFTIPASTFRTALLLPSITSRIDDMLIVKELNFKMFNQTISERHLHSAISTPSAGIEFDYERLELLGDAFLKYLSSLYVFVTNPAEQEGVLHIARQQIISNRSLLRNAISVGLPQFVLSKTFTVKLWRPPSFSILPDPVSSASQTANGDANATEEGQAEEDPWTIPETTLQTVKQPDESASVISQQDTTSSQLASNVKKRSKKQRQQDERHSQWLGDKAVADVAEAIIGAAYISGGREGALKACKALNIKLPNVDRWSDFDRKALAPPPAVTAKLKSSSLQAIEKIIGHRFNRPHLLAQALTHTSIPGHESACYERLEFIGDAILDFMVIRHIFDRDVQLSPGALTLLKGAMVSNSALAAVCVRSGLHDHLLYESHILRASIQLYIDELNTKQVKEYQLAEAERRQPGQYWLEIEPPKALSDVVESIIGAIYVSDNFSPTGAEAIFENILKPFYDRHITLKTLSHHPTKILFELFQAQGCQTFEIIKRAAEDGHRTRCDVIVHDVILASATDTTAISAARRASLFALDAVEGDANFLTRTCDCRAQGKKSQGKAGNKEKRAGLAEEDEEMFIVEECLARHEHGSRSGSEEASDMAL